MLWVFCGIEISDDQVTNYVVRSAALHHSPNDLVYQPRTIRLFPSYLDVLASITDGPFHPLDRKRDRVPAPPVGETAVASRLESRDLEIRNGERTEPFLNACAIFARRILQHQFPLSWSTSPLVYA